MSQRVFYLQSVTDAKMAEKAELICKIPTLTTLLNIKSCNTDIDGNYVNVLNTNLDLLKDTLSYLIITDVRALSNFIIRKVNNYYTYDNT